MIFQRGWQGGAVARTRARHSSPLVTQLAPGEAGGIAPLSPALERTPEREVGEREASRWPGGCTCESDLARSDWST